jgi:hypothetical protein
MRNENAQVYALTKNDSRVPERLLETGQIVPQEAEWARANGSEENAARQQHQTFMAACSWARYA